MWKIIRNKIPEFLETEQRLSLKRVSGNEKNYYLYLKIHEEFEEFKKTANNEEASDILEVLESLNEDNSYFKKVFESSKLNLPKILEVKENKKIEKWNFDEEGYILNININQDCIFCKEYENKTFYTGEEFIPSLNLYENKFFYVRPALWGYIEWYLLIISKDHFLWIRWIPEYLYTYLDDAINWSKNFIQKNYSDNLFFYEHWGGYLSCQCISHLHLHMIPIRENKQDLYNLINEAIREDMPFSTKKTLESFNMLKNEPIWRPYIIFGNIENYLEVYYYDNYPLPSQYLRQLCAEYLWIWDFYNWRKFPFLENVKNTFSKIHYLW